MGNAEGDTGKQFVRHKARDGFVKTIALKKIEDRRDGKTVSSVEWNSVDEAWRKLCGNEIEFYSNEHEDLIIDIAVVMLRNIEILIKRKGEKTNG